MGTPSQIAIIPLTTRTAYDPVKDFAPISVIGTNPYVLVVHPRMPANTLAEFVDYARGHSDKLTYVAPIFGGLSHLSMVLFLKRAGLEMTPVSYKGGAAPLTDVIAGHVPIYFATLSEAVRGVGRSGCCCRSAFALRCEGRKHFRYHAAELFSSGNFRQDPSR
jgi:tripartite-type tricarboxylate transporter receptor subunit TctC